MEARKVSEEVEVEEKNEPLRVCLQYRLVSKDKNESIHGGWWE